MATPSGNAVKGASARPVRYPVQLVIMLSDEAGERIAGMATELTVSKSEAARALIDAGLALDKLATEYGVPASALLEAAELAAIKRSTPELEATRPA